MNRLRESSELDSAAAVLLAGAFQASGQGEAAEDLLEKCKWQVAKYRDDSRTFGSDFRDKAVMVRTLVQMNQAGRARKFVDEIVASLSADTWYSTQETAYGLMAVATYYGGSPAKPFRFKLGWEGEAPREVEAAVPFFQQLYSPFNAAERKLMVANPGQGRLYLTATIAGIPAAGAEKAQENNLRLEVAYQDLKGEPFAVERMTQGERPAGEDQRHQPQQGRAAQPGADPLRPRRLPDRQPAPVQRRTGQRLLRLPGCP